MTKERVGRHRISLDVSAHDMRRIDRARGSSSRAAFCWERIVLSQGFADPSFDLIARMLGKLAMISTDRWDNLLKVGDLMNLAHSISQNIDRNDQDKKLLEETLNEISGALSGIFAEANLQRVAMEALLEMAHQFVSYQLLTSEPLNSTEPTNWHRTGK